MKKVIACLVLVALLIGSGLQAQDAAKPALRTWKDSTGQFSIEATFVRVNGNQVVLQGTDKKEISLPLAKLSVADQQYVKARPYVARGNAYLLKGEYDKTIADCTEGIRLNPTNALLYCYRGAVYVVQREFDKAIADCTEAIRIKPDYAEAYFDRGRAYFFKGEYDKAIAQWTEAIRLDPTNAEAYFSRGLAYGSKKREFDKEIADCTEAIRIKPDYAKAYYNRGAAYREKGDKAKAEADFAKAKELGYDP